MSDSPARLQKAKIVTIVKRIKPFGGAFVSGPRMYGGKLSSAALMAELQAEGYWGSVYSKQDGLRIVRTGGALDPGEYNYVLHGEANSLMPSCKIASF